MSCSQSASSYDSCTATSPLRCMVAIRFKKHKSIPNYVVYQDIPYVYTSRIIHLSPRFAVTNRSAQGSIDLTATARVTR